MTDELRAIFWRLATEPEAVLELHALDNLDRTGCRAACLERGVQTYCATHYRGEDGLSL